MRKLAVVCAVVLATSGLAGCIDGIADAVANIAGFGTTSVLNDIDEGLAAGEVASQQKVDAWVAQKETELTGLPLGSVCTTNGECQSGFCNIDGGGICQTP